MAKLRVYELAEQMNKTNKEILSILKDKGIEVASHMSTLSDEQIDAVKSEKTSEDTPKKKNIVQVFRPQNSQGGGRGRNGQGRQQGSRNGQRSQGNGNGQGRPQGNGNRQERPQNGNSQGRPQGNGQGRPQNGNRQERPQGNGNGQGRPQNGNRQDRPQGENRDNRQRRNPNGPRNGQDQRQGRPGDGRRDGGFQNRGDRRDNRDNRDGREMRDGGRRDDRRKSSPSIPAPAIAEQKPSRNKPKDAHKKKEYNRNEENEDRLQKGKKGKNNNAQPKMVKPQPKKEVVEEQIKQITIPEVLTIQELADAMKIQPSVIVKKLFMQGKIVTVNQEIDYETAEEIALEFDVLCEKEEVVDVIEELLKEDEEDEKKMKKRPPVVCVMGHVDHGKTSLLDKIRDTHVIAGEAGGITQHIGASVVEINGEKITFLDTPGHEAFTAMRMRGANSTDIAILVVAADDGVMPQTVEAINHAKAAGIEIVVAINKIDKPSANIDRVKQELTEYELIPEDWGGSTVFVPVSAHTKEGIEQLLEMIVLTSEVLELKANPNRKARGIVIEARLDKGRGPVATVLVQKGTLHIGDHVAVGPAHGKVRAMIDHKGERVKVAAPSTPVEILGLNGAPDAGEIFVATESDKEAKQISQAYIDQSKDKLLEETKSKKLSLDGLFNQIQAGNVKDLNLIIKADVQGSVEAVKQSLLKLGNEEVAVRVIHGGVGAITESDVSLASASNAIIIGFNIRPDNTAKEVAERENVDVRLYRVIYDAIEDIENALKGMLEPIYEEKVIGHVEVRQTFKASGVGTIAGSYVLDGKVQRGCRCRVYRGDDMIFEGDLASLKRFKDDVKEVAAGYECGLVFSNFNDIQMEDRVECYIMVEVPR